MMVRSRVNLLIIASLAALAVARPARSTDEAATKLADMAHKIQALKNFDPHQLLVISGKKSFETNGVTGYTSSDNLDRSPVSRIQIEYNPSSPYPRSIHTVYLLPTETMHLNLTELKQAFGEWTKREKHRTSQSLASAYRCKEYSILRYPERNKHSISLVVSDDGPQQLLSVQISSN